MPELNKRFNIALFPDDTGLQESCVLFAQSNLKDSADQYLLGDAARPHITLSQFEALESELPSIWSSLVSLNPKSLSVLFHHIYILPGKDDHLGCHWIGVAVALEPELIDLQKAVSQCMDEAQVKTSTASANYFPHLTWARCRGQAPTLTDMPPAEFWGRHQFSLSIGRSDNFGVYYEKLYPAPA